MRAGACTSVLTTHDHNPIPSKHADDSGPAAIRYLGGWPARHTMAPEGSPAILDCTCELPRMLPQLPYHNLPMWDTHGAAPQCSQSSIARFQKQHLGGPHSM